MTGLAIHGWGVLGAAGDDPAGLAAVAAGEPVQAADITRLYPDPLPSHRAYALVDFDVRAELGRKGTSFFDRRTALTVAVCGRALADAGLVADDANRHRVGVVLGTTAGSVKSAVDYAVETFTQDPPHLVNPALFPNTVMNCAAGQTAIWYGLTGVNATVAGGPLAMLSVLRYAANTLRCGQADALLAGAVEEYTPHAAWLTALSRPGAEVTAGEGGAVFVAAPLEAGADWPRHPDAEVLAVVLGFCPPDVARTSALARCVRRALEGARVDPGEVRLLTAGAAEDRPAAREAAREALGLEPEVLSLDAAVGDCQSAVGAFELAAVLARHRSDPARDGEVSLLTAQTRDGAVGAAVIRGWSRGPDRG